MWVMGRKSMTREWGDSFRNLPGPVANSPGNCAWGCYVFPGKRHEKAELSCQAFHWFSPSLDVASYVKRRGPINQTPRRQWTCHTTGVWLGGCGFSSQLCPHLQTAGSNPACSEFCTDKVKLVSKVNHHNDLQ